MFTTLPAPIDSSGAAVRRSSNGQGLDAPNPESGGLTAATPNLSMSFANEIYRRSGGTQGVAPTAAQLAHEAAGGSQQLTDYQWNSVKAGKYATSGAEEMLWHQTGGRLGLPGAPDIRQASAALTEQQTGPQHTSAGDTAAAASAPANADKAASHRVASLIPSTSSVRFEALLRGSKG